MIIAPWISDREDQRMSQAGKIARIDVALMVTRIGPGGA